MDLSCSGREARPDGGGGLGGEVGARWSADLESGSGSVEGREPLEGRRTREGVADFGEAKRRQQTR